MSKFYIEDWAGNTCFHGKEFDSIEEASSFLMETLGDDFEEDCEDYYYEKVVE